jgi:hypothetical protein
MGLRLLAKEENKTPHIPVFQQEEKVTPKVKSAPLEVAKPTTYIPIEERYKQQSARRFRFRQMSLWQKMGICVVPITIGLCALVTSTLSSLNTTNPRFQPIYQLNAPSANEQYIKAVNALDMESGQLWEGADYTALEQNTWDNAIEREVGIAKTSLTMTKNRVALTALSEAANLPYTPRYYPKNAGKYFKTPVTYPVHDGLELPAPDFVRLRLLARLGYGDARMLAERGEHAKAIARSVDVIRLGHTLQDEHANLVTGVIGTLIQGVGLEATPYSIDRIDAKTARAQIARLEQLTPVSCLQMVQDDQRMVKSVPYMGWVGMFYGQALSNAALPYYKAQNFKNSEQQGPEFIRNMVPNTARIHWAITQKNTQEQILLAKLALRAYWLKHQQSAPNLETLVTQKYLKQVPRDGFSMTGNASLQYDPKTGDVWSVGNNGKNDSNTGDDLLEKL